mmetsp:Transcript_116930/g.214995  ORF Transcript_116930/g.214995 Transcript_116930/m.214995 type:complete len:359 (+) Transcript_116930:60-1136(+)
MYRFALLLVIGPIKSVALQVSRPSQDAIVYSGSLNPGAQLFDQDDMVYSGPLNPRAPLFEEELEKKLFNEEVDTIAVDPQLHAPKRNGGVSMAHYHKTGCIFSNEFGAVLKNTLGMHSDHFKNSSFELQFPEGGKTWDGFWHETIAVPSQTFAKITSPSTSWRLPEGTPLVHWYRDPVDLVMSGYRYHSNMRSAEPWEYRVGWTPRTDAEAHKAIFSICQNNCTYLHLLGAAPEERGVKIEMLMERQLMQNMVGNLQRWANNAQVLHLSMSHLTTDFNSTMKCILKFMDLGDESDQLFMELQQLDHPSSAHVTHGLYDNSALRTTVEHANWGAQQTYRALFKLINERQKMMFGCPVPV